MLIAPFPDDDDALGESEESLIEGVSEESLTEGVAEESA